MGTRPVGSLADELSWLLATACGVGRAPVASGTVASAVAALLWYIAPLSAPAQGFVCGVTIAAGIWAASRLASRLQDDDPSDVVIDEFAGMWLTLLGLPKTLPILCAGFFLFRLLDIGKFPPMRQLERLPGGLGIMMDDVAAGLIGRVVLGVALAYLFH